jgi:hypothetical protein
MGKTGTKKPILDYEDLKYGSLYPYFVAITFESNINVMARSAQNLLLI